MIASGNWVLHFSWGCTPLYWSVDITFHNDGTITGEAGPGHWEQQNGTLMMSWAKGPAKYSGTVDGYAASGAMTAFDGSQNGCWYLLQETDLRLREAEEEEQFVAPTRDAMGNTRQVEE
jgi:hypothetical protein